MSPSTQTLKIKCPHCGWIRAIDLPTEGEMHAVVLGVGDLARSASEALQELAEKFACLLEDKELTEANAWIDMPKCPECGQVYQYNVRTRKTR